MQQSRLATHFVLEKREIADVRSVISAEWSGLNFDDINEEKR